MFLFAIKVVAVAHCTMLMLKSTLLQLDDVVAIAANCP